MNDFECQALLAIRQQYPKLIEVRGSFTFDCTYRNLDGEVIIEIPFGEWRWHYRDTAEGKHAKKSDWLSWFKYYVFEDLERFLAFRLQLNNQTSSNDGTVQDHDLLAFLPRSGRLEFEYGKLMLHWYSKELCAVQ